MPRRYFSYPERFWPLNVASTAGASVLAAGLLLVLVYLLIALRHGERVADNPWRSRGYEWLSPSPPPPENFEETPVFTRGPHEYDDSAEAPPHPSAEPRHVS
jgi:cytochrome c oxidase subunit 1